MPVTAREEKHNAWPCLSCVSCSAEQCRPLDACSWRQGSVDQGAQRCPVLLPTAAGSCLGSSKLPWLPQKEAWHTPNTCSSITGWHQHKCWCWGYVLLRGVKETRGVSFIPLISLPPSWVFWPQPEPLVTSLQMRIAIFPPAFRSTCLCQVRKEKLPATVK